MKSFKIKISNNKVHLSENLITHISKSDRKIICKDFDYIDSDESNAELVAKLFNLHGVKIFESFEDPFFFFIYNALNGDGLIVRDHVGFNSIYYAQDKNNLFLSSSLSGIKELFGENLKINIKVLKDFLEMNPFSDKETFFKEIKKVPPAHYLKFSSNKLLIKPYRKFRDLKISDNEEDQVKGLNKLLKKSIIREEESLDNNIGFLFSGGLDSSTIVSFFNKFKKKNQKIFTYTAQFHHIDDSLKGLIDEKDFQKEILKNSTINHTDFETKDLSTLSNLDLYLRLIGQPFFFPHLYLIDEAFRLASSDGVKKVFSGADGDTVISHGFEYLVQLFLKLRWIKLFFEISKTSKIMKKSKKFIFKRAVIGQIFYNKKIYFSARKQHKAVLNAPIHANALEIKSLIADFYGITQVHPFYNINLINYCTSVRPDLKIKGYPRYILREAIKGVVPEKNRKRLDKSNLGHGLVYSFLNKDRDFIESQISSPHHIVKDLIDVRNIKKYWRDILKNPRRHSTSSNVPSLIFSYVVANRWLQNNYNKKS